VDSEEFYQMNTALTDPSLGSTKDPQRGLMKTIFGIDLDDAVRAKLDKDAFYDGYSVMDINEISKQETYDSVAPGTYFSFTPTRDFDPTSAASAFNRMVSLIDSTIDSNIRDDVYTKRAIAEGLEADAATARAMELAKEDKRQKLLNQVGLVAKDDPEYINRFRTLLKDNGLTDEDIAGLEYSNLEDEALERKVVNQILKSKPSISTDIENTFSVTDDRGRKHDIIIGTDKKVKSISVDGTVLREDQIDQIIEKLAVSGLIPSVQLKGDEVSVPEPEVPITDSLNLEIKVPPRPNAFTSRFTGVSLDYETRQQILNGEIEVPDNLRVDEWDELFGDTHDPETGRKLSETPEITEEEPQEISRDNPFIFPESMSNAEKQKAYDNLPSGTFYIHPVTNQLSKKQ